MTSTNTNQERLAAMREKGYDFDLDQVFREFWEMFLKQPLFSMAFTLLIFSLQLLALVYLDKFVFLFGLLLAPPLYSGFYLVAFKISAGQPVVYPDFFTGFTYYFPTVLIWLVGQVLVSLGIFALIIPGVYLAVAYNFAVLMAIFGGFDYWSALEESRKLITVRWWKFFVYTLLLLLINLGGILTFGVGLLVSVPVTFYSTYILFEQLTREALAE
ncbi:hypothetical protein [Mariniradius sediminis]|uniref:Membrane protein YesL n=1 Tax=Mariniradius sediminis TaxID=2909237 RepID=A0ABS9BYC0_9BACT|nr:hypothetical protein [Mariniradius sediminis]MCF1752457.1 hypothetical protein [Mariniradius sediminis]